MNRQDWRIHGLTLMVLLVFCIMLSEGEASLVGDRISYRHAYPKIGIQAAAGATDPVIEYGAGDQWTASVAGQAVYVIDSENTQIRIDFYGNGTWQPAEFNGLEIFNIDSKITDVQVATNLHAWDARRIVLDHNQLRINWQGLSWGAIPILLLI